MNPGLSPSPGIRVTMLLADHAAVAESKLYISGAGWSQTGPQPAPSAIALSLAVPWSMTNQAITFHLRLLREDGEPVMQPTPVGEAPIEVSGQFEVGRPPGLTAGTPIDVPLAFNIPPLPLPPGSRFSWELTIDGQCRDDWHLAFSTRAVPAMGSGPTSIPGLPG